jgi:hypothetical protein
MLAAGKVAGFGDSQIEGFGQQGEGEAAYCILVATGDMVMWGGIRQEMTGDRAIVKVEDKASDLLELSIVLDPVRKD